jgi:hypothetical protein
MGASLPELDLTLAECAKCNGRPCKVRKLADPATTTDFQAALSEEHHSCNLHWRGGCVLHFAYAIEVRRSRGLLTRFGMF